MSRHKDAVHSLAVSNKISMEELLDLEDEIWERLEDYDPRYYEEKLEELESIDEDEATEIVKKMKLYGECWSMNQIRDFLREHHPEADAITYYLCMNMARNDYYKTASRIKSQNISCETKRARITAGSFSDVV